MIIGFGGVTLGAEANAKEGALSLGLSGGVATVLTVNGVAAVARQLVGLSPQSPNLGFPVLRGFFLGDRTQAFPSSGNHIFDWSSDNYLTGVGLYSDAELSVTGPLSIATVRGMFNRSRGVDTNSLAAGQTEEITVSTAPITRASSGTDNARIFIEAQAGLVCRVDKIKTGATTPGTSITIASGDSYYPVELGSVSAANADTFVIVLSNPTASSLAIARIGAFNATYQRNRMLWQTQRAHYRNAGAFFGGPSATDTYDALTTNAVTQWRTGKRGSDGALVEIRHNAAGVQQAVSRAVDQTTGAHTVEAAINAGGPVKPGSYTVATLPSAATAGQVAYASNGRTGVELAAAGTGCPVFSKAGVWMRFDTNTQVQA